MSRKALFDTSVPGRTWSTFAVQGFDAAVPGAQFDRLWLRTGDNGLLSEFYASLKACNDYWWPRWLGRLRPGRVDATR